MKILEDLVFWVITIILLILSLITLLIGPVISVGSAWLLVTFWSDIPIPNLVAYVLIWVLMTVWEIWDWVKLVEDIKKITRKSSL